MCRKWLGSASIRRLLLVLATARVLLLLHQRQLFFCSSRLVTFCTGMTVLLILFRLQLARDSRHTVGLGTSTNKSCLVIVFYAVKTYDWSIDTKEAGRGLFCIAFASAGRTCAALSCRKPSGKNSKKAILLARYAGQPKSSCGPWWLDHT